MIDKTIEIVLQLINKIPSRKLVVVVAMLAVILPFVLKITDWQPYVIIASVYIAAEAVQMGCQSIAVALKK